MFKSYYSNITPEISRGSQGVRYKEKGAGGEYRYEASYNYKGLRHIIREKWYRQCSIERSTFRQIAVV